MYYLCIKTHNKTNLKYLCQTKRKNPKKYLGSGTRWLRHIKKHGKDISTIILGKFKNKKELIKEGKKYSKKFNVTKSKKWANLRDEEGDGGDTSKHINYKAMKPMPRGIWKRPDLTKYNQNRINPNKNKKLSKETRLKMSKAQTGRILTNEHRQKISLTKTGLKQSLKQRLAGTKIFLKVGGKKSSLMQIAEEKNLSYTLLIQRYIKNKKISFKKLVEPSLKKKMNFNGQKLTSIEFKKKYNIKDTSYYRWKNKGYSLAEMIKKNRSLK
jgi:hypothetical protein